MKTREIGIKNESSIFFTTPSNQTMGLFYYITCIGHFMYEDYYKLDRDSYPSFLIMYIKKGSGEVYNSIGNFKVAEGDILLLNCYEKHGYRSLGNLETIWFHFDGLNSSNLYHELSSQYDGFICKKITFTGFEILQKCIDSFLHGTRPTESMESVQIFRLLVDFFQVQEEQKNTSLIDQIKEYIEANFSEELSIKILSAKANLSEFHFSRVFKKETGYTIHEYIVKTRINHAKSMLQATNLPLKEITYACGFANESSFSTTFKKHTGITPGMFKKMKF